VDEKEADFARRREKSPADSASEHLYRLDLARVINTGRAFRCHRPLQPGICLSQSGRALLYDFRRAEKIDEFAGRAGIRPGSSLAGCGGKWCAYYMAEAARFCPTTFLFPHLGRSFSAAAGLHFHGNTRDRIFTSTVTSASFLEPVKKTRLHGCGTARLWPNGGY